MSSNRYQKLVDKKRLQDKQSDSLNKKLTTLRLSLSSDFSGNDLNDYLDKKDANAANEFIELMSKHNFAGSEKLYLSAKHNNKPITSNGILSKEPGLRNPIKSLKWVNLWKGRGYFIGVICNERQKISRSNSCPVYLCSDGKLRCKRSGPVFGPSQSISNGVGTIPNPEDLGGELSFVSGIYEYDGPDSYTNPELIHFSLARLLENYVYENVLKFG